MELNGASAEGGQLGTPNEHRFSARIGNTLEEGLGLIDDWGGPKTYNHYSWGWAWAGNTPLRLWKRYTWLGGTRTPLIVHWPGSVTGSGEVRSQFAHVVDLAPTILGAVGIEFPEALDGVPQQKVDGVSLIETFDDPLAPERHHTQYFEMLGSRSIYAHGWKATTDHISTGVMDEEQLAVGSRSFGEDRWELFHLDEDFSESTDCADTQPEVLTRLQDLWLTEAQANQVLPIDDTLANRIAAVVPNPYPAPALSEYRPDGGPIADESLPFLWGGFKISAEVTVPEAGASGVLFALGDWNGGYALVAIEGRLHFALSRAGQIVEVTGDTTIPPGHQTLSVTYANAGHSGVFELRHDDLTVGRTRFAGGLPLTFQHGGASLRIGADAGLPVTARYEVPSVWAGVIDRVVFAVPGGVLAAVDDEIRAALHGD